MVGWCGSECHDVVFNNSRCQSHAPVPRVCEGQSRVCIKLCVLLQGSVSLLVLGCSVAWRECWHGGGVKSVGGQWMEGKRASGVGGIVTRLWWLVFGLWCPHAHHCSFPFAHWLMHLVAPCVVDRVIGWRGVVWVE